MKSKAWLVSVLSLVSMAACQKTNDSASATTLSASTTQATVGQTVSVRVNSNLNTASWTVTPSASVSQTYGITTRTTNYFKFNNAGTYTIGVRMRSIDFDSTHQSLDSCWHHGGGDRGGCHKGVDSASLSITVTN